MYTLKQISQNSLQTALAKAERYRLLNEPLEAESICRDILEVDPANREARISMILALTDEFPKDESVFTGAMGSIALLESRYEQAYYSGVAWERRGKALYESGRLGSSSYVYECIARALKLFEQAEHLSPPGNDDAILRWNACVRFLERHKELAPAIEDLPAPILSE